MFSYQQTAHHNHHGGRRRQPRQQLSAKNNQQFLRQQPPRTPIVEQPTLSHLTYKRELEASISFDEESDLIFCPFHLLTEDDLQSIHSGSDKSSLSSGSPQTSPMQTNSHITPPSFVLSSMNPYAPATQPKVLHQPLAQRNRNAIPIINPDTRSSVSPARQMRW